MSLPSSPHPANLPFSRLFSWPPPYEASEVTSGRRERGDVGIFDDSWVAVVAEAQVVLE